MSEDFRFKGFEPSHDLEGLAKDIMWKVEADSPSKAMRTGTITKSGQGYSGSIKVCSLAGVFRAAKEGKDPMGLLNELATDIHEQLETWKRSRYKNAN